ncbi:MAG TPA: ergothioneine biosynthesis protein EgtB [Planctomycetota bacterium]|nr:ergothioneine biosynthesis protein EgtB [Planctomycetota bacterium]
MDSAALLQASYRKIRATTERLCEPLATEDYVVQSMPDASPVKWHLAHTTWFFERLVLRRVWPELAPFHETYDFLFNSYYETLGPRQARAARGLLARPTVAEVAAYRRTIDERILDLLEHPVQDEVARTLELGIHHEQQHQELLLTDLKHAFSLNPLAPVYRASEPAPATGLAPLAWFRHEGGLVSVGHAGEGFAFDNERPRHKTFLVPFELADRLVTVGELARFIEDGGYRRPELWLSDGWATCQERGWRAPLYWEERDGRFDAFTLAGVRALDPAEPVCHVSYYEADAFARWAGARLPREHEWEAIAAPLPVEGNLLESGALHPRPGRSQLFGDCWEWTQSPYVAYPGFVPPAGALGEYNAKFMCNQIVLRGGSCVTPRSHIRASYRNFFPPDARWQFSGIRLARDAT